MSIALPSQLYPTPFPFALVPAVLVVVVDLRSRRPSAPTPLDSMRQPGTEKQGPGVVRHQRAVRDPPPKVYPRGSIFGMPTHMKGSHYTIHPEWPDFYPSEDFVH